MSNRDPLRPKNWSFRADIPQRYNDNARLYRERGGQVQIEEDVKPFAADNHFGDSSRFFFFCLMQDQIFKERLKGDIAELGVYKGMTASVLANIARRAGRTAYLFDTFEGFDKKDLVGIDKDKRPEQFTDTSLEAVRNRVGTENVRYVQGRFPESAAQIPQDLRFCLVHIDCDLFEPITAALEYFYPRMVPGGFMVIHDYSSLAWNGAERAVDAFFADKLEFVIPLTDGGGSAVVRRALPPEPAAPLPEKTWIKANDLPAPDILRAGWSKAESWGVWGTGDCHTLTVPRPQPGVPVHVELDCAAALVGAITEQTVDVTLGEGMRSRLLATWHFTKAANRAIRVLDIPADESAVMTISLRPAKLVRPVDQDPANSDSRILGAGLHRIRVIS